MSYVSGIVIQISSAEEGDEQEALLKSLEVFRNGVGISFKDLSNYSAGSKNPQISLFCGGFNYLEKEELLALLDSFSWYCPEQVVVTITTEDDPTEIYRICKNKKLEKL